MRWPHRSGGACLKVTDTSRDRELLTAEEAAAYLRVSQYTIWRWCRTGRLPAFRIGRAWRIRKDRLDELIERLEAGDTDLTNDE